MPLVRTVLRPWEQIEVDDAEAHVLAAQGLIAPEPEPELEPELEPPTAPPGKTTKKTDVSADVAAQAPEPLAPVQPANKEGSS